VVETGYIDSCPGERETKPFRGVGRMAIEETALLKAPVGRTSQRGGGKLLRKDGLECTVLLRKGDC